MAKTGEKEATGIKLLIFGSRDINKDQAYFQINEFVTAMGTPPHSIITAGEPEGACEMARRYAQENGHTLTLFFKQLNRAQGMYHWRSVMALNECDEVLFLYNGTSKGTKNEMDLAAKMEKKMTVYLVEKESTFGWNVETNESKW